MKITAVESIVAGDAHFVRLLTDAGVTGLGQSAAWAYPAAVHAVIGSFRPYLVGADALRREHHWQHLYRMGPFRGSILMAAVSAVDIALWDIAGKAFGQPVWQLLGGQVRDRVRLHLLLEGSGPQALSAAAERAVAEGFTAVKFDPLPGDYADLPLPALLAATKDTIRAVREVAPQIDIILEMHRKLTPAQALPVGRAVAPFDPLFWEDPIQIDSVTVQADVAKAVGLPIALGERFHTIWEFEDLLRQGGTQFVRPDLGLAGGLSHVRKIAAVAEAHHATVVTHNFLGPVLTAASVHLDVAIPNVIVQEYTAADSTATGVVRSELRREGGWLPLPTVPGLGVELVEGALPRVDLVGRQLADIPLRADGSVAFSV